MAAAVLRLSARLVEQLANAPDPEAASAVEEAVRLQPALRPVLLGAVRDLVEALPAVYPRHGTVARSGSYKYLRIDDAGHYVRRVSALLESIERGSGLAARVAGAGGPAPSASRRYGVEPPPSPCGSHVTISPHTPDSMLGAVLPFRLAARPVVTYADDRRARSPSGFDASFYPLAWYVLYVEGLPAALCRGATDEPHISVGLLGWRS